ncbi:hypothetical protein LSH36_3g30044 [Paralvinella palmiformis]|uniref:Uncharacterized protein n=1 Tax=Paralvinella palmiformis TaxID=53620 RepID=A0AAD9KG24_9ANNE|nr:hypothetical protein LSH36_3g30044 [Paralvinella palmiformis]
MQKAPCTKVGLARQYLIKNFATLPSDGAEVLNGHVLFLYTTHDRVLSCTLTALKDVVPGDVSLYSYQIKKLCKLLKKFRHLTDESEHTNFAVLCHEVLVIAGPVPSTITESATPLTCDPAPSSDGHVKLSLRKGFSSPRRDRIRKRLEFVSKGKFEMKRKYVAQMKDLNAQHHKTVKVKYLNQVIKRKDVIIVKLKKLVVDSLHQELTTTKIQLAVLMRKHRRLKLYRQCTRTSTSEPIAGNTSKLHHELQYKDTVIRHLENEILVL